VKETPIPLMVGDISTTPAASLFLEINLDVIKVAGIILIATAKR